MADTSDGKAGRDDHERYLVFSLQAEASHLRASDGRMIPFTRAILTMRNVCDAELVSVVFHATLGQEGGTVQDISSSLSPSAPSSIPPGGTVKWDVYDTLLPAHPGAASKIHMFGYRAALNWRFDLAAWAEYRSLDSAVTADTPVSRWTLRWGVADTAGGEVALVIEEVNN
ncbi:MAG: hypothetical protein Q8K68_08805 [Nitrospirota bacterium]|nr:hypothetical protein [Nitrospirota bacterium]